MYPTKSQLLIDAITNGVVVADGASGRTALATQGVVPVRVQGPFNSGDVLIFYRESDFGTGFSVAALQAQHGGLTKWTDVCVGTIQNSYEGEDVVLTPVNLGALPLIPKIFRLQILDASESGTDKIRVRFGKCGGYLAASTMDEADDATPFIYTLTGTGARHVYARMPITYLSNGVWQVSADGSIGDAASVPANEASYYYVDLGSVDAPGDGTGVTVSNPQPVSGDQRISRIGNSAPPYVDSNSSISEP